MMINSKVLSITSTPVFFLLRGRQLMYYRFWYPSSRGGNTVAIVVEASSGSHAYEILRSAGVADVTSLRSPEPFAFKSYGEIDSDEKISIGDFKENYSEYDGMYFLTRVD